MHFGFRLHAVHSPRSTNKYSVVCMEANGISEQTIKLYYCVAVHIYRKLFRCEARAQIQTKQQKK